MNTTDTPDWTPTPAGWYTVVVLDDEDTIYAYFTDPDSYTEYLADCGMSTMLTSCGNHCSQNDI